jgi:hypothetical protein
MPGASKTSLANLAAYERQEQALELRKAGKSFPEIARLTGYSLTGVQKAVRTALKRCGKPAADEVRRMELERLDRLWENLWGEDGRMTKVLKEEDLARRTATALLISKRRADLLGLDAPVKVAATDAEGTSIYSGLSDEALLQAADAARARIARRIPLPVDDSSKTEPAPAS